MPENKVDSVNEGSGGMGTRCRKFEPCLAEHVIGPRELAWEGARWMVMCNFLRHS